MTIIQFSPGRSGSTLVWNILKQLIGPNVQKTHHITSRQIDCKIISTIRDPRDILKSRLLITEKKITKSLIDCEIKLMLRHGMLKLIEIKNRSNVLILKYESFWNNYDFIFDSLETFLNITITQTQRKQIDAKVNLETMKKISDKYSNFSNHDSETGVHGKHISSNPEPNQWKSIIPAEFHKYILEKLGKYLTEFGYV